MKWWFFLTVSLAFLCLVPRKSPADDTLHKLHTPSISISKNFHKANRRYQGYQKKRRKRGKREKNWQLFLGSSYYLRQLISTANTPKGTPKSFYGEVKIPTFLEIRFPLNSFPSLRDVPEEYSFASYTGLNILGHWIQPEGDSDGGSVTAMTFFGFRIAGPWMEKLKWTSGLGLQFYSIHGQGGITTLNDGTGTSNFYLASKSTTSRNYYLSAGLRIELNPSHQLQLNLNVLTPFSRLRRTYEISFGWFIHIY